MYDFIKYRYVSGKITLKKVKELASFWLSDDEQSKLFEELNCLKNQNGGVSHV